MLGTTVLMYTIFCIIIHCFTLLLALCTFVVMLSVFVVYNYENEYSNSSFLLELDELGGFNFYYKTSISMPFPWGLSPVLRK